MKSTTIVIVGGGVIGLSAAYHLARKNAGRIIVLEKETLGDGSSSRAAGITTGLLWNETGVATRKRGIEIFRQLSEELEDYTYHDEHGCLNLIAPEHWPAREALLPIYDRLGASYELLSAADIHRRWPDLHPAEGWIGLHDPNGGYSEPHVYIAAMAKRLRHLGVELRQQQRVDGFLMRGERVVGVRIGEENLEADMVLSTVHAWSHVVWRQLGLRFPMKTFVHQRYVTAPLAGPLVAPAVNADPLLGYIRPAEGDCILLGVETPQRDEYVVTDPEFRMTELATPQSVRDDAVTRFESFLPQLRRAAWESEHVGLLSFSADGDPIMGPIKDHPGLFVGASFHSGGFSYNTVAGLMLAEYIADGETSIDVSAFSPDRYTEGNMADTDDYLATTIPQSKAIQRRH